MQLKKKNAIQREEMYISELFCMGLQIVLLNYFTFKSSKALKHSLW